MSHAFSNLNVPTAPYLENQAGGIMVCGINWGGEPSSVAEEPSFFSDATVGDDRFRNRLLSWFELWGYPLATERGHEGAFERSIVRTNWLRDQQRSMRGKEIVAACIAGKDNFFRHLRALRPRVVFFCGSTLIHTLNDARCKNETIECLGRPKEDLRYIQKEVMHNGKVLRRFRVGFQRFKCCDVIGLPHPTGSVGLSDRYIAEFADEISPILEKFKSVIVTGQGEI